MTFLNYSYLNLPLPFSAIKTTAVGGSRSLSDQHDRPLLRHIVTQHIVIIDGPHIRTGRLRLTAKSSVPSLPCIGGLEHELSPSIEDPHFDCLDKLRIFHPEQIIMPVAIRGKSVGDIQFTDAGGDMYIL